MGAEVLAIDSDAAKVAEIKQEVTAAVCLNTTHEDALGSLGVDEMDAVVVAIGRDVQASILTTALLQQAGCPYIVARASNELHAQILGLVGADRVIYPEDEAARRLVRGLASPHILDQVDLEGDIELAVLTAPRSFCGKSLTELSLRQTFTVNVVAIRTAETDTQAATTIFPDCGVWMGWINDMAGGCRCRARHPASILKKLWQFFNNHHSLHSGTRDAQTRSDLSPPGGTASRKRETACRLSLLIVGGRHADSAAVPRALRLALGLGRLGGCAPARLLRCYPLAA